MNLNLNKGLAPIPGKGKPVAYECVDCKSKFLYRKNLLDIFSSKPKCPHCGSKNVKKTNDLVVM